MPDRLSIDPDIRRAQTLPAEVYHRPHWYERMRERVFVRTWHLYPQHLPDLSSGALRPWNLLAGCLDEPLLLTQDGDQLRLLSNVCTHRGAILVERPGQATGLRCGYHGRRFTLAGRFVSAPHFEQAEDFPRPCDHLAAVPCERWQRLLFASLEPRFPLSRWTDPVQQRLGHLPWDALTFDPGRSRDYHVAASWALYCDNYLEGLHIPFVHASLNQALDFEAYRTELWPLGVLQIGRACGDEDCLPTPAGHPDHGQAIAAYYCWLFPCTMLNVYPWGVSINIVIPLGPQRSRIVYLRYVWDEDKCDRGAGGQLDEVEHEDERIVEAVARGVKGRLYRRGRYSPSKEQGVHHFHRLLAEFLAD